MTDTATLFLWVLFEQLRRRRFLLGPEDWLSLRTALRVGFGWRSNTELCNICCALWAKSHRDQETIRALFEQLAPDDLKLLRQLEDVSSAKHDVGSDEVEKQLSEDEKTSEESLELRPTGGLPPVSLGAAKLSERHFVYAPQYPISYREVAQAWRRLRRPVREGPPIELDIGATIRQRSRAGVPVPPALTPRRRNTTRLLLLVDRGGSMAPFHSFSEEVCTAMIESGRLKQVARYYFHDNPVEGADDKILDQLPSSLQPQLDGVLHDIQPLTEGDIFEDQSFLKPHVLQTALDAFFGANAVIFSDGGAARGRFDLLRLLDTVAFFKALRIRHIKVVWLNPLPRNYWHGSTAAQIARHVPMFPLDRDGIYQAVNVLRGQPAHLECSV